MKKLKNADILTIAQSLNDDMGKDILVKKLPVKITYAIKYDMEKIMNAYDIYAKALQDLAQQYDAELGKRNVTARNPEDQPKLNEELTNLLQEEVELELKLVPMDIFEKCGEGHYDALTFAEIERLSWLIEDEE